MSNQTKKKQEMTLSNALHTVSLQDLSLDVSQKKETTAVAFSTWIRSLRQNWRQGTVGCKGRSDVAHSNKKPWKQKGTGRARAGSARSPLWRGGGVTFGPQPRVRNLTVSQKMKKGVMNSILFNFVENNKVTCLDWSLEGDRPKTSLAYSALKSADLHNRKITIFVPLNDMLTYASFINMPNVRILFFDQANAFDLVDSEHWVVFKKDLDQFKEMASQWI